MERIALVTGGLGYVGRNLVKRLVSNHYHVRILDDSDIGNPKPPHIIENSSIAIDRKGEWFVGKQVPDDAVELVQASATNEGALNYAAKGVSVIFHLSETKFDPNTTSSIGFNVKDNVAATVSVLETARRNGARVIMKSIIVNQKERTLVQPNNHYLASKCFAEQYVSAYARWHGMQTVTLRLPEVFGKGSTGDLLSRLVTIMLGQEQVSFPCLPRQSWDFCYIDNVIDAFILASEVQLDGSSINIASGESQTVRGIIRAVQRVAKTAYVPQVEASTTDLTYVYSGRVDITRAQRVLGYKPRVGFEIGLRRYINELRATKGERMLEL